MEHIILYGFLVGVFFMLVWGVLICCKSIINKEKK